MKPVLNWMIAACLAIAGCRATVLTPSPADALREKNQELEAKNSALEAQVEELQAQLAGKSDAAAKSPSAELEKATPRVAKISIGDLSRVVGKKEVAGKPALPERLLVFLNVEDGKGRAFQLSGDLTLEASLQASGGKLISLASVHLSPLQLRDLYRTGFGNPHYSLEAPIHAPPDMKDATALVVVTYTDGWTGRTLKTERAVPWPLDDESRENPDKAE